MPALGMAQETGKLVAWLKQEGAVVSKGEPLMEIETDKATVEIEAPTDGVLSNVAAKEGADIPVGQIVGFILAPGEDAPELPAIEQASPISQTTSATQIASPKSKPPRNRGEGKPGPLASSDGQRKGIVTASPLALRMVQAHDLDLSQMELDGRHIRKADVLAYLAGKRPGNVYALSPASPKARMLAGERGLAIETIAGSGPGSAVLAADVLKAGFQPVGQAQAVQAQEVSNAWRIMAERMTQSWTSVPHFFLLRQANASRLAEWLESERKHSSIKITYSDLLVKIVAAALSQHPHANASWRAGGIYFQPEINVGLAVATDDALVAPVIHGADALSVGQIARQRETLVAASLKGRLKLDQIQGGTFTISNLGMYGVDVFNAIVNPPQAAILAVGRIADHVVAIDGQPTVQPLINLSLSCDHRVIDGVRAAQFLATLANLVEDPKQLIGTEQIE